MLKQHPGGELPPSPPDPGVASPLNFKEAVRDKSSGKGGDDELDEWVKRLTKIAERPWKVKDDDNLRPMVPAEEEALVAWIMGALVLDAPPAFLVCTHSLSHRVAFLDFFETYLEGVLVAIIPPHVRMPKHVAERTLLAQLAVSEKENTTGHIQTCNLIRQVKRADYNDATRRLTFVVKDTLLADSWHHKSIQFRGTNLKLLSTSKLEEEDMQMDVDNKVPHDGELLRYQVRVLTHGIPVSEVKQVIGMSTDCKVMSFTRQTVRRSDAYDSNYFLVVFDSDTCPTQLKGVTHIEAGNHSLYLHHFQQHSRIPCFNCYSPDHSRTKCPRAAGEIQQARHRTFALKVHPSKKVTNLTFKHMETAERLGYVEGRAKDLDAIMAKAKAAADKNPLLVKLSSDKNVPSPPPESTKGQNQSPLVSDNEWFDPATSKKVKSAKRGVSTAGSSQLPKPPSDVASSREYKTPAILNGKTVKPTDKRAVTKIEATAAKVTGSGSTGPGKPPIRSGEKGKVGNPGKGVPQTSTRSGTTASAKRKIAEAALEAVLAEPKVAAPTDSMEPAKSEVRAGEPQGEAQDVPSPLGLAQAKAETAAEASVTATKLHEVKEEEARSAKAIYQHAAATAHTEALNLAAAQDEGDGQLFETAEEETANREAECKRIEDLAAHLSLLDHQYRQAAGAAQDAHAGMVRATAIAKKAAAKYDKLYKASQQVTAGQEVKPKIQPADGGGTQTEDVLANAEAATRAKILHQIRLTLEPHFANKYSNRFQPKPKMGAELGGATVDQAPQEAKAAASNVPVPLPPSEPPIEIPGRTDTPLDETMRFNDLGTVTPPQHAEPVPFPPELKASFDHFGHMNTPVREPANRVFDADISMVGAQTNPITAETQEIPPAAPTVVRELRRQRLDEAVQQRALQRQREDHAATLMRTRRRKGQFDEEIKAAGVNSAPPSEVTVTAAKAGGSNSAEADSDYDISGTKPADTAPVYISDWNAWLKLSEIPNEANGHCLYFALRDALHEAHPSVLQGTERVEQTERLRATVLTMLLERLEREVRANQIDAAQLFNRYTNSSSQEKHSQEELIGIVEQHLCKAAAVPVSDMLPRQYWGGTDELRMAALALGRNIYVLDVQNDGAAYLVQYTPVRTFCNGTEDWASEMRILRGGTETTAFCEKIHHRPCILLCRRGATESSHFTALRSGIVKTEVMIETTKDDAASANFSVQERNQETSNRRSKTLLRRMVGTRAEIAQLTKADLIARRQRHSSNCAAMDVWAHSTRLRQAHAIPAILPRDVSKLDTWVTNYADALVALLRALPFPVDVLRSFSSKKLIELGNIINSQSQLALIQHHATDDTISEQVRDFCTKWSSATLACKQGSARWRLTDDVTRWSRLNALDDSLLTATTDQPIEPERWAIINVSCRTQKLNGTGDLNSYVKSWKRSPRPNLGVSWLVDVKSVAKKSQIGVKGTAGASNLGVDRHTTLEHGEPALSVLSRSDVLPLSPPCTDAQRQSFISNPTNSTQPNLLDPKEVTGNPIPRSQAVMTDFFASVEPGCKADLMRSQFQDYSCKLRRQKRRTKVQRQKMMRHEATIGMHTQNVMGLTKTKNNITAWLNHFRQNGSDGAHDIIFLQETHVEEHEVSKMSAMHSRHWGFDPSQEGGVFSHWSVGRGRKGGVAILRNPYSQVQELKPYMKDHWSSHWMAVTAEFHGETLMLANIYAPTDRALREAFYQRLAQLPMQHTGPILCGGDFNCTLHPMADRSLQRTALAHDSPSLRTLLRTWGMVDALQRDIDTATDTRDLPTFHQRHHTYGYTMATGQFESSRLDRWYVSTEHDEWIRCITQSIPGPYSDHNGVSLRVAAPDKITYVKKPRKVYPVPEYAAEKAEDIAAKFFDTAVEDLESLLASETSLERQAKLAADWWDDAKLRLKVTYLEVKKECASKLRNSYRQKLRRLHEALHESDTPAAVPNASTTTVLSDCDDMNGTHRSRLIRKQIAECKLNWQEAKALRLRRAHAHHPLRSSKEFFRRISTKFGDNTIYSLGPQKVGSRYAPKALADLMAEGWGPTMQQQQAGLDEIRTYLQQVLPPEFGDLLTPLTASISDEEIRAAIKRCKRSKAHGPDELGNDWYRDHEEDLVPLFKKLFNLWYSTGVIPDSFRTVNIHCIKKSRTAAVPLDHRPIALLNTDYKIYTRVFATRLTPCLPDLVHPLQAGFVPGRSIHTPIDTFFAVRKLAKLNPRLAKVTTLLLDFAKAYDSLCRDFLILVLRLYGLPKQFCDMVAALHRETTCRFLVNGFLSKSIRVTCGIRQGCPMAPLLFIIALDVLYRIIEAMSDFPGVDLECGGLRADLRVSGFADDTAIYLNDSNAIPKVVEVLQRFGDVSGLRVNLSKSICVPLGTTDGIWSEPTHGIPTLRHGDSCRYLGIQVGTSDSSDDNWKTCEQALAARLSLAVAKTHSVIQRAEIARVVIVPKILYIARHAWPSAAAVDKLQRFTKGFVWGKKDGHARRAWLSEEQAELAMYDGGISMPSIKTELLTLSAVTVARWAANATDFEALIGDILLARGMPQRVYITPSSSSSVSASRMTRSVGASLWDTGAGIVKQAHALCYTDTEIRGIRECATILTKGYEEATWQNGGYYIDAERFMTPDFVTLIAMRRKLRGTFCAEWLRCCSTVSDGWLLDRKGTTYNLARSPIARGTTTLQQLVRWNWVSHGRVCFEYVPGHDTATAPSLRSFQRLCFALLYNFPHLLYRPHREHVLRPYSTEVKQHHEWLLQGVDTLIHYDATMLASTHKVRTSADLDKAGSRDVLNTKSVKFHAHPSKSRLVQVWGGECRWKISRKRYKRFCSEPRTTMGRQRRDATAAYPENDTGASALVLQGLKELSWHRLHRIPGMNTYERQVIYKLKAGKISSWNFRDENRSCPVALCDTTANATALHIFWECPQAQTRWRRMLAQWERLGLFLTDRFAIAIFSLTIPNAPMHAWNQIQDVLLEKDVRADLQDHIFPMASLLWRYMCGANLAAIWRQRNQLLNDGGTSITAQQAISDAYISKGMVNLQLLMESNARTDEDVMASTVLRGLVNILTHDSPLRVERCLPTDGQFLLFFDGGSRGNPGPGGSGSVLLKINATTREAAIVWVASMAYGHPSTTNNMAEYWGLIHGLRYAHSHRCVPLHVVGDSAMIIRQQKLHHPPKKPNLARLYYQSKRVADTMTILSWSHHYRANNKMADLAANHAMDSTTSTQYSFPTARSSGKEISDFLEGDVQHWFDSVRNLTSVDTVTGHDLNTNMRTFLSSRVGETPAASERRPNSETKLPR